MDRTQIGRQIEAAVRSGFAITNDQMILGEIGVACPIRTPDGQSRAAIQCSVSSHHWNEKRIKSEILPWLMDAANSL